MTSTIKLLLTEIKPIGPTLWRWTKVFILIPIIFILGGIFAFIGFVANESEGRLRQAEDWLKKQG